MKSSFIVSSAFSSMLKITIKYVSCCFNLCHSKVNLYERTNSYSPSYSSAISGLLPLLQNIV